MMMMLMMMMTAKMSSFIMIAENKWSGDASI